MNELESLNDECKAMECRIAELKHKLDETMAERDKLLYENKNLHNRINYLTGNVEAYEFCIKNGACRK